MNITSGNDVDYETPMPRRSSEYYESPHDDDDLDRLCIRVAFNNEAMRSMSDYLEEDYNPHWEDIWDSTDYQLACRVIDGLFAAGILRYEDFRFDDVTHEVVRA